MEKIQTKIIRIGNSQGIRLPKHVLEKLNITGDIELVIDVESKQIHIHSIRSPRSGWEQRFQEMHGNGDDQLIIDEAIDLDNDEWDW